MGKILKGAAVAVLVVGMSTSVSASTADVFNTGPGSRNEIRAVNHVKKQRHNNNNVDVENNNPQQARTGDVYTRRNTTAGNVRSGNATNDSLARTNLAIDNETCDCDGDVGGLRDYGPAIIEQTGPESHNRIHFENRVRHHVANNNNVRVRNNNPQQAHSGNVNASYNTTVGDVASGDAHNVSTVENDIGIRNN